jgi:hypothetical protein
MILKPRFLYACSEQRKLFYDREWKGLDAGEFKRTNIFLSLEEMKVQDSAAEKEINFEKEINNRYKYCRRI